MLEAFHLTLVKINRQNRKHRKRIDERTSFVYNVQIKNEFFLLAEGGVRSFAKVTLLKTVQ